jgi:hypothetical protein
MNSRRRGVLLRGLIATSLLLPAAAACLLGACGDDTVMALPDAGSIVDATTLDVSADVSDDASEGGCVPFDAASLDPNRVAAGKTLVGSLGCKKCHGGQLAGNGDGVVSPQTEGGFAYPPNLTPDPATGLGCWTDDQIETAFLHGIDNEGSPLCPPMPHFAEAGVDASGALDIVEFLRSLAPIHMNVPNTPNCTLGPLDDGGSEASSDDGGETVDAGDGGDGAAKNDASEDAASSDAGDASRTADASGGGG